jgi:hypothetical protein
MNAIFWNVTLFCLIEVQRKALHPSSGLKYKLTKQQEAAVCRAYSSTLKMEAICSSEMSANVYQTT